MSNEMFDIIFGLLFGISVLASIGLYYKLDD